MHKRENDNQFTSSELLANLKSLHPLQNTLPKRWAANNGIILHIIQVFY